MGNKYEEMQAELTEKPGALRSGETRTASGAIMGEPDGTDAPAATPMIEQQVNGADQHATD